MGGGVKVESSCCVRGEGCGVWAAGAWNGGHLRRTLKAINDKLLLLLLGLLLAERLGVEPEFFSLPIPAK